MAFSYDSATGLEEPAGEERRGSLPRLIVCCRFLLAWVIRSFIFAPFNIPSGSMLPAAVIGDYLFVAKWPYGYSRYSLPSGIAVLRRPHLRHGVPERGDVVVFRAPGTRARTISSA